MKEEGEPELPFAIDAFGDTNAHFEIGERVWATVTGLARHGLPKQQVAVISCWMQLALNGDWPLCRPLSIAGPGADEFGRLATVSANLMLGPRRMHAELMAWQWLRTDRPYEFPLPLRLAVLVGCDAVSDLEVDMELWIRLVNGVGVLCVSETCHPSTSHIGACFDMQVPDALRESARELLTELEQSHPEWFWGQN